MFTDVPTDTDLARGSTGPADAALVDDVSTGDVDAFLELWRRHRQAAYTFARRWAPPDSPTETAVNRAFADVLLEISAGCDVDGPFRLHLYRTLFAERLVEERPDLPLVLRAFGALSAQSRTVLWYRVVEDEPTSTVALLAGVPAGELYALHRVAEVELRTRWLAELVEAPSTPPGCAWMVPRIDLRPCGVLAPASEVRYDSHLERCPHCRQVVLDLTEVGPLLRSAVHTLVAPRQDGTSDGHRAGAAGAPEAVDAAGAADAGGDDRETEVPRPGAQRGPAASPRT